MDHSRAILGGALFFHHVDELKGVADGTVRVRPAGGTVVLHLQNIVILSGEGGGGLFNVFSHMKDI